jgi:hypothetical protein
LATSFEVEGPDRDSIEVPAKTFPPKVEIGTVPDGADDEGTCLFEAAADDPNPDDDDNLESS